jgi:tetratricopeptide (TPR) repeat protein
MLQPEIDNRIVWLLAVENRREEAKDFIRKSISKYGMSPEKISGLARILRAQNKSTEAREIYMQGITAYPRNFELIDEYVIWLENEGRAWEAITLLRDRLSDTPESITQWLASDQIDPERIDAVETIISEKPEILGMTRRLSVLLMNNAESRFDLEEGVRFTKRTLDIAPDNHFAYRALALGYVMLDRNDEGIKALYRSLEIEPNEQAIRQQLFDLLTAEGRLREAEAISRGESPKSDAE